VNNRFRISPLTWGRISAIKNGAVRPGNSIVNTTACGATVTVATSGAPGAGPPAGFFGEQPTSNNRIQPAIPATMTEFRLSFRACEESLSFESPGN
jgi:hypothetical protein